MFFVVLYFLKKEPDLLERRMKIKEKEEKQKRENSYASRIIEVENGQKVITTGPYAIVRHPMYLGVLLMYSPFALGSYWALPFFLPLLPLLVYRLLNEEEVLLKELPGYKEYCQKTRYHLIPFIQAHS